MEKIKKNLAINSVVELIKLLTDEMIYDPDSQIGGMAIFRGQSQFNFDLKPSIARLSSKKLNSTDLRKLESKSINSFKRTKHLYLKNNFYSEDKGAIPLLMDMQHFSFATRLLDWSYSAYVALYFAVNKDMSEDGALFVWDYGLTNLENLDIFKNVRTKDQDQQKDSWFVFIDEINAKFIHVVSDELHYNERMSIQQGCFTVSNHIKLDHGKLIEDHDSQSEENFLKIKIPFKSKPSILKDLKYMNISASHLFPGMDGVGREFTETLNMLR
jgi:hypothetical protein